MRSHVLLHLLVALSLYFYNKNILNRKIFSRSIFIIDFVNWTVGLLNHLVLDFCCIAVGSDNTNRIFWSTKLGLSVAASCFHGVFFFQMFFYHQLGLL